MDKFDISDFVVLRGNSLEEVSETMEGEEVTKEELLRGISGDSLLLGASFDEGFVTLRAHTRVGGYPLAYLQGGEARCPECAEQGVTAGGESLMGVVILWENTQACGSCGKVMESAYSEDEEYVGGGDDYDYDI